MENSAGAGSNMGDSLEELEAIMRIMNRPVRLKVCLDTAHLLASGYEIRTKHGWNSFLEKFDNLIGLDRLAAIHLNDSMVDIDTKKDRHENIGYGFIGEEGFKNILNHPKLQKIPGILEVPGMKNMGPDEANLKKLIALTN